MYTRYYDPEIFVQTFDGIDRTNHIVATYYMEDALAGEDFIDHFALIQALALEGSTGTWEKVEEDTEEVRRRLSGQDGRLFRAPHRQSVPAESRRADWPSPSMPGSTICPMMLLSIAGNCFAYSDKMRLLDVFIPEQAAGQIPGAEVRRAGHPPSCWTCRSARSRCISSSRRWA